MYRLEPRSPGPAELPEQRHDGGDRQSDHVGIRPGDPRDEPGRPSLYGIAARLAERLAGTDVGPNLVRAQRRHPDRRPLHVREAPAVAYDGQPGEHLVRAARQPREHPLGVGLVTRFAEQLVAEDHRGIGADHEPAGVTRRTGLGLEQRDTRNVTGWRFVGDQRLVHVDWTDVVREPSRGEQLAATWRGRGEDGNHSGEQYGTILGVQALNTVETRVLRTILDRQPLSEAKVRFAWRLSAGPTLGSATSLAWSEDGRLRVTVRSDEWRRELLRARAIILERLQDLLGKDAITAIHVTVAPPVVKASNVSRKPPASGGS